MGSSNHFLLIPVGSAGDVYPFVGLGIALRARGHRVTVMTSGYFENLVRAEGLEFVDTLSAAEFLELTNNPRLWHPYLGAKTIFDSITIDHLRTAYRVVSDRYEAGRTVAVTSCLGFGARIAHDRLGMPLATVDLQPFVLWSKFGTPKIPAMPRAAWVPRWWKQFLYRAAERLTVDPLIAPKLNLLRAELSLPPVSRITSWWHSPQRIVGMFPEWFARRQPDWPPQLRQTQFPLWNPSADEALPREVSEFLAAGEPPIVFTPGSAHRFGFEFFRAAGAACRLLGRRGMLFTRFDDQIPAKLPAGVQHFRFAPFRRLLPTVAAIVHHGGIGTTAQAMAAGIPQLIMPLGHDQPDNAERIRGLGLGDAISPQRFQPERVAEKMKGLLTNRAVAETCRQISHRFMGVDPYEETCRVVESLAGTDLV